MARTTSFIAVFLFLSSALWGQEVTVDQLDKQARQLLERDEIDSAIVKLETRASLFKQQGFRAEFISAYIEIADLYIQLNDYNTGLHYLNRVASSDLKFDSEDSRVSVLEWYLFQGYVHEKLKDYLGAKEYYDYAYYQIVKKEDDIPFQLGKFLFQPLGNIYSRLGEFEQSIIFLEKFLSLSMLQQDNNATAEAYSDIGIVYVARNQIQKAINYYRRGLKVTGLDDKPKALLLSNLASALILIKEDQEALELAKRAVSLFDQCRPEQLSEQDKKLYKAWTIGIEARVYLHDGELEKALKYIDQSLESTIAYNGKVSREIAKLFTVKGSIYLKMKRPEQALLSFQQALSFLFVNLNENDSKSNPSVDQLYAENAIIEALNGKALANYELFQIKQQYSYLREGLKLYQLIFRTEDLIAEEYNYQLSKLKLLQERNERSHQAMNICFTLFQHKHDTLYWNMALDIMERNKAQVLLESLSEAQASIAAGLPAQLVAEQKESRRKIAYYQKSNADKFQSDSNWSEAILQEQRKLEGIEKQLQTNYPEYGQLLKLRMRTVSFNELQDYLRKVDQSLVEFFFTDQYVYGLYINRNEVIFDRIDIQNEVSQMLRYIKLLHTPPTSDTTNEEVKELGLRIFQNIAAPFFESNYPNQLIVVPDGLLTYLPLESLPIRRNFTGDDSTNYLLGKTAISYSFSSTWLMNLGEQQKKDQEPLAGYAPVFENSNKFLWLRFSEDEMKGISNFFDSRMFTRSEATKSSFMKVMTDYHILHLSTHSAVDMNEPLNSWIAFYNEASQPEDSVKLYLSEIYNLKLTADLVVLSACETGTGFLSAGEGVMSLARGFAFAGCPSTVTTLWQVNDQATATLNILFYKYLKKGYSKDKALQQAKLDYLSGDDKDELARHPFFWSSLIVIGDVKAIEFTESRSLVWWVIPMLVIIVCIVWMGIRRKKSSA